MSKRNSEKKKGRSGGQHIPIRYHPDGKNLTGGKFAKRSPAKRVMFGRKAV